MRPAEVFIKIGHREEPWEFADLPHVGDNFEVEGRTYVVSGRVWRGRTLTINLSLDVDS